MTETLVTGAHGFLAGHLIPHLQKLGHHLTLLDKIPMQYEGCEVINTDLRFLKQPREFDYIFHLAGVTIVPYAEANPEETYEANILGLIALLRAYKGKFIFVSSAAVYGKTDRPCSETDPLNPRGIYALSKKHAEELVQYYSKNYVIARMFNMYGPSQNKSFLVPQVIRQAYAGKITLRNGIDARDYVYVKDAVDALILLADKQGVYNIGTGIPTSALVIAEEIRSHFGKFIEIEVGTQAQTFAPSVMYANPEKILRLGWKPRSLEEGLKETIDQTSGLYL